ncbi:MAG: protein-L-isoaspartate O-methyltransferase family protein [Candidatus Muiribacteriota bacterium]
MLFYKNFTNKTLIESIENNYYYLVTNDEEKNYFKKILKAIEITDRKYFVKNKDLAYLDTALPLNCNQTISQPSTVFYMLFYADIQPYMKILDIGTGSGWNAALAAYLAEGKEIYSLEIIEELTEKAKDNLNKFLNNIPSESKYKYENIIFKTFNIFKNQHNNLPVFDRIIITAGINKKDVDKLKKFSSLNLAPGGKLICPLQEGPMLFLTRKKNKIFIKESTELFRFVPLSV